MTTTDKPSIAELQRAVEERRGLASLIAVLAAAPVLLEIVAAGKAWEASDDEDRADELDALLAALAKVRQ